MAEYTWRQWENEQNDENLLHASDCERWQAGIELAGGTWDGSWTDLDTSGKGLITIDQFNALESQIQSKVSSYTPKNYDPDSTVQIVPGPDGWNKVEDGILKAVCTPDGVNRNWLLASREQPNTKTGVSQYASAWSRSVDEDGFGVFTMNLSISAVMGALLTTVVADDNQWADKQMVFSLDCFCDALSSAIGENILRLRVQVYGTNNFTSYAQAYYELLPFNTYLLNPDDVKDGEWCRLNIGFTQKALSELSSQTSTEYSTYIYAYGLQKQASSRTDDLMIKKQKVEFSDVGTPWSDNPEDYGGSGDSNTLTASPQSVEDGDEIPAVEAGEIE